MFQDMVQIWLIKSLQSKPISRSMNISKIVKILENYSRCKWMMLTSSSAGWPWGRWSGRSRPDGTMSTGSLCHGRPEMWVQTERCPSYTGCAESQTPGHNKVHIKYLSHFGPYERLFGIFSSLNLHVAQFVKLENLYIKLKTHRRHLGSQPWQ